MPSVQRLSDDYAERGVRIFGVNVWESGDPAEFMRDNGYTYGLLLKGDDVAADLNVNGIPTFFLIGVDGEIIARHVGGGPDAMNSIRPILDAYLEKHDM